MAYKINKICDYCGHSTLQSEKFVSCPMCKKGIMWPEENIIDDENEII